MKQRIMRKSHLKIIIAIIAVATLSACKLNFSEYPYNATELTQKYYLYERRANRQFLNEEITVKGTLSQVTKDKHNNMVILLARNNAPYGVKCIFNKKNAKINKTFELNTLVTVKGICIGLEEHVVLENCTLE